MTVILSHIGIYDENVNSYILFKKCYESVLSEFKNDNIFVYHSLKELFNKFPGFEEEYNKYSSFLDEVNNDPTFTNDLVRFLLSHFIDDYLYLDSDIYVYKGLRNYLMGYVDNYDYNLIMTNHGSTSICYCKHRFENLDFFMDRIFNDGNYTFDADMNKKYGLMKLKEVYSLSFEEFTTHFNSLRVVNDFITKIVFLKNPKYNNYEILSDLLKSIPSWMALATSGWMVFKDYQGIIKSYNFLDNKKVSLKDVISTSNSLGGKVQYQEIDSFDLGGLN